MCLWSVKWTTLCLSNSDLKLNLCPHTKHLSFFLSSSCRRICFLWLAKECVTLSHLSSSWPPCYFFQCAVSSVHEVKACFNSVQMGFCFWHFLNLNSLISKIDTPPPLLVLPKVPGFGVACLGVGFGLGVGLGFGFSSFFTCHASHLCLGNWPPATNIKLKYVFLGTILVTVLVTTPVDVQTIIIFWIYCLTNNRTSNHTIFVM